MLITEAELRKLIRDTLLQEVPEGIIGTPGQGGDVQASASQSEMMGEYGRISRIALEIMLGVTPAGAAIDAAYLAHAVNQGDTVGAVWAGIGFIPGIGDLFAGVGRGLRDTIVSGGRLTRSQSDQVARAIDGIKNNASPEALTSLARAASMSTPASRNEFHRTIRREAEPTSTRDDSSRDDEDDDEERNCRIRFVRPTVLRITLDQGSRVSRDIVLVTLIDGSNQAFFKSSGVSGGGAAGRWLPFEGYVTDDRVPPGKRIDDINPDEDRYERLYGDNVLMAKTYWNQPELHRTAGPIGSPTNIMSICLSRHNFSNMPVRDMFIPQSTESHVRALGAINRLLRVADAIDTNTLAFRQSSTGRGRRLLFGIEETS